MTMPSAAGSLSSSLAILSGTVCWRFHTPNRTARDAPKAVERHCETIHRRRISGRAPSPPHRPADRIASGVDLLHVERLIDAPPAALETRRFAAASSLMPLMNKLAPSVCPQDRR